MKYKFLRFEDGEMKSHYGDVTWKLGEWNQLNGDVELYDRGFHCSNDIYRAFSSVQGEFLALVEVDGTSENDDNLEAWSQMKVVRVWKWENEDSVALAKYAEKLAGKPIPAVVDVVTSDHQVFTSFVTYIVVKEAASINPEVFKKVSAWMNRRISKLEEVTGP